MPYLKFRLNVRFLSRAPIEGFLGGVAAVDSPAACEDDGELLRLSSFLLIGSTATSSVTTIITSGSLHLMNKVDTFSKHTPPSNQIASVSLVMLTHKLKEYATGNFKCRIKTEGFLKVYSHTHCKSGNYMLDTTQDKRRSYHKAQ